MSAPDANRRIMERYVVLLDTCRAIPNAEMMEILGTETLEQSAEAIRQYHITHLRYHRGRDAWVYDLRTYQLRLSPLEDPDEVLASSAA